MVAVELSKIVVVTINIIFMIFGLAVLIVGIIFKVGWDEVRDAFVDNSDKVDFNLQNAGDTIGIAAIVFGCFMILLSIMGCIGGCCRVRVLLVIYAIVVLLLLIGQIAIVGYVAANGSDAEDKIKEGLEKTLDGYYEDQRDSKSKAWSAVFSTFECCGIANRTEDFTSSSNFHMSNKRTATQAGDLNPIPIACCRSYDYESAQTEDIFKKSDECLLKKTPKASYTVGCETEIKDRIVDNKGVVIGVGVAIFIIELLVVIMSFYLVCKKDDSGYTV
ncbi:CD82 antigen [Aplysia californica]|uniref:Tetraspanin n=1 Tax=Aplysia californica TaxID=6500 RepID=A0ABM0JNF3_APLCA|nr:CD82 antigen [Aplysia californica]